MDASPFRLPTLLALLAIAFASPWAPPARAATGDETGVLVLGRISDDPNAHYEQLKPLLDYVVPRMAGVGIREGRILMARDTRQMESYLRRGRVDWVTETSANAMVLQDRARAVPLLLTERGGVSRYRSVFFAREDSGVDRLDLLRGHAIAFQNPNSTSAYFVPAAVLLGSGMPMEVLLSPRDRPGPDSVGYVFARSELNIATWVHKRLVDAGVMSDLDWRDPRRMPPTWRNDFVVLHESAPVPRALEMVRGDMPPAVRDRLREVLLQAADDPEGREALLRFFNTTAFAELGDDDRRALDQLRAGIGRVRDAIE